MKPRISDLQVELDDFRNGKSILEQACDKLMIIEAAMHVIGRHDLWTEFAAELQQLSSPLSSHQLGTENGN